MEKFGFLSFKYLPQAEKFSSNAITSRAVGVETGAEGKHLKRKISLFHKLSQNQSITSECQKCCPKKNCDFRCRGRIKYCQSCAKSQILVFEKPSCLGEENSEDFCLCVGTNKTIAECECLASDSIFDAWEDREVLCGCYLNGVSVESCRCANSEMYGPYCECLDEKTLSECDNEFEFCDVEEIEECLCRDDWGMSEEYCEFCLENPNEQACVCGEGERDELVSGFCDCLAVSDMNIPYCGCVQLEGFDEDYCDCVVEESESEEVCNCTISNPEYTLELCECIVDGDEEEFCKCIVDEAKTKKECYEEHYSGAATATQTTASSAGMVVLIVIVVIIALFLVATAIFAIVMCVCWVKGKQNSEQGTNDVSLKDVDIEYSDEEAANTASRAKNNVPEGYSASLKLGKSSKVEYKSDSMMIDGDSELKFKDIQKVVEVDTGNPMTSSLKVSISGEKPVEIQFNRRNQKFKKDFIKHLSGNE